MSWKEAGRYLFGPKVLDLGKAECHQHCVELVRIKIAQPGFSQRIHMSRTPLVAYLRFRRERIGRIAVVEYDVRAIRETRDEAQGRPHGFLGQIRHHAKPSEKRLLRRIKTSGRQPLAQGLAFEIDGRKSQRTRYGDCGVFEASAFPLLSSWMIHFEDVQPVTQRAAIGVGIESRTEHYHLADASFNSFCQSIFREASPGGDENSHPSPRGLLPSLANNGLRIFAEDPQGTWIGKDTALF